MGLALLFTSYGADNYDANLLCKSYITQSDVLQEEYDELFLKYTNLQTNYTSLKDKYNSTNTTLWDSIDNLTKTLNETKNNLSLTIIDRDKYKSLYENSSLGKISIQDFYTTVNNFETKIDQSIKDLNIEINNRIFWLTLSIVLVLDILLWPIKVKVKAIWNTYFNKSKKKKKSEPKKDKKNNN